MDYRKLVKEFRCEIYQGEDEERSCNIVGRER
jgi:hypothetical protein